MKELENVFYKKLLERWNLKRLSYVGYVIKDKFELVCFLVLLMKSKLNSKSKMLKVMVMIWVYYNILFLVVF